LNGLISVLMTDMGILAMVGKAPAVAGRTDGRRGLSISKMNYSDSIDRCSL
jgi:hypothetical protein